MKTTLKTLKRNALGLSASAASVLPAAFIPTAGAATPPVGSTDNTDAIIKSVIEIALKIFFYIGLVLLIWSIGMLVLAFKNEDANSKSSAIMMIVVSVSLIALRPLAAVVLNAVGFSL